MDLNKPLAYRVRPTTLEEFVGQEEVVGKDKILYRTIKADRLSSVILWGPTGCGKTSLAKVISSTTKYNFIKLNAVTAGVSDIKRAVEESKNAFLISMSMIVKLKPLEPEDIFKILKNALVNKERIRNI